MITDGASVDLPKGVNRRAVHVLVEKNESTMRGVCKKCGPVDLVWRTYRLACAVGRREGFTTQNRKRGRRDDIQPHGLRLSEARAYLADKSCEICGVPAKHVDHNHETGKIRGALCVNCNIGIGYFADNPERLEAAARYLRVQEGS